LLKEVKGISEQRQVGPSDITHEEGDGSADLSAAFLNIIRCHVIVVVSVVVL
jgi:hypothetical protein